MDEPSPPGVFINCPFDDDYRDCQLALVLTVVACGLDPRSALETGTAAAPRMQRISNALCESPFSIHDLTRPYGDSNQSNLARFNMPFEFGMAFLYAEQAARLRTSHDWIALLPEGHQYGEFISDLSGYDLETHGGTPDSIIPPVLAWLSTRVELPPLPPEVNPSAIIDLMDEFRQLVEAEDLKWRGRLPWRRRVAVARDLVASRLL